LRIFAICDERFRMMSLMYSGSSARGMFGGILSTSCDGTETMKSSGASAVLHG
jgi:hypothetical protein